MPESDKILVFIPTYNEAENVESLFQQIRDLGIPLDILFLDDNSPDGTGQIIDQLVAKYPGVFAIHRENKLGIGSAHKTGIDWAYRNSYKMLITMDSDFTHSPLDIPTFIAMAFNSDIVIGSRYLEEGSLRDWNIYRRILTRLGHRLTVSLLKIDNDASGAYRLYRLDSMAPEIFDRVYSNSYSFFFESLYILKLNGCTVTEFPIDLPGRTYGHSKMALKDIFGSVFLLVYLCLKTRLDREALLCPGAVSGNNSRKEIPGNASSRDWDAYWQVKHTYSGAIYDLIASFYRKFFIRRELGRVLRKYFARGATLLHAGCGGGQVDAEVNSYFSIIPMDMSFAALCRYWDYSGQKHIKVCGDLMHLPASAGYFDGVYNLGVMEHFNKDQIQKILVEFHRVLKSNGIVVLFWPPVFGLSVMFLKVVHLFAKHIWGKNLKLHPDEISLVKSRRQVEKILQEADFKLLEYRFGYHDFFTHVVVIAMRCQKIGLEKT